MLQRDVYLLGGKTVVKDAPHAAGPHVATTMSGFLLPALSNDDSSDALRCTVLDLYSDLFARFGGEVSKDHPVIVDALLQLVRRSARPSAAPTGLSVTHVAAFPPPLAIYCSCPAPTTPCASAALRRWATWPPFWTTSSLAARSPAHSQRCKKTDRCVPQQHGV